MGPKFENETTSTIDQSVWTRMGLAAALVVVFTFLSRHLQLDDALIYDRYINNDMHGLGLVYNAGERVNALTSPLYVYCLLVVTWILHGHVQMAAVLIAGATLAGACMLAERLFPYSGLLLATMAYFYLLIGMETPLLLFLLMLAITLYVRSRDALLPAVLALLILTRLEAGALAVVIAWNLYRDRRIPKAIWYAPVAGLLLVHFWLNVRLYNSIVSDSSKAKIGQGMSGYWGPWPTAFLHVWHLWPYFEWTPYVLLGVVFFAYRGAHQLKGSLWNRAVLPFLGILFCFYWLLNLPGYHWYYAPFIFLTTMMAVAGIPRGRPQTLVLISVLAVQGVTNCFLVVRLTTGEHEYARVANWLATTTAPNATVAACEIGEIGWLSHRYIFDILGLTTPKNAIYISHRDVNTWLVEDRPDYIVVHKPAWVWEQAAVHNSDYEETSFHSKSIVILHRKDLH